MAFTNLFTLLPMLTVAFVFLMPLNIRMNVCRTVEHLFIYLFVYLFIYLLTKRYIQMYCHVQREQDNKAQITGINSCPLSLNHTATDTDTMQCI